jgi:hypothetical protein
MADPEEKRKNLNRLFPKLWYGWIGKGTKELAITTILKFIKEFQKN